MQLQENGEAISIHGQSLNHSTVVHNHTGWSRTVRDERSRIGIKTRRKIGREFIVPSTTTADGTVVHWSLIKKHRGRQNRREWQKWNEEKMFRGAIERKEGRQSDLRSRKEIKEKQFLRDDRKKVGHGVSESADCSADR